MQSPSRKERHRRGDPEYKWVSFRYTILAKQAHLRHECRQTSNRVDNGTTEVLVARIGFAKPDTIQEERKAKERESDGGNDLGEKPNFFLDGRQLEFCLARHADKAAHDGAITGSEDYALTVALCDKR